MELWRDEAACVGQPTKLFFPAVRGGKPVNPRQVDRAKSICRQCPVIEECRNYKARHPAVSGIWAGVLYSPTLPRRKKPGDTDIRTYRPRRRKTTAEELAKAWAAWEARVQDQLGVG